MKSILLIAIIILINVIDAFATFLYCQLKRKHDDNKSNPNNSSNSGVVQKKKRVLRFLDNYYGGWIRFKLHRLGGIPCHSYRNFILKKIYLMQIAKTAVIYGGFEIRAPWNIVVGSGTIIGDESKLDGRNGITIGRNVNFSTGVWIWTEQHDLNDPFFSSNNKGGSVIIEDRAWLSARTTVLPKVRIKEGAVIAAGAVVTKDCEPFSVYGGVPAKRISDRNSDLKYCFNGTHIPFY